LAPAEISRVIIDEENRAMEVIVPDEFLSVAIGKRGQNVRLASKLSGWHLDVNSEAQYNEAMQKGYESLKQISGVGISMADMLFEKGFYSAEELANAEIEDLVQMRGIGEEKAKQLISSAQASLEAMQAAIEAEEQESTEPDDEPDAPADPDQASQSGDDEQTADAESAQPADDQAESTEEKTEPADLSPADEPESH
jgi:transcription termination/antitermination protein NusA